MYKNTKYALKLAKPSDWWDGSHVYENLQLLDLSGSMSTQMVLRLSQKSQSWIQVY